MEFRSRSKSLRVAYCLYVLFGLHYAYVGKWWLTLLYFCTCGGAYLWALVDLFRVPSLISRYNHSLAISVLGDVEFLNDKTPASSLTTASSRDPAVRLQLEKLSRDSVSDWLIPAFLFVVLFVIPPILFISYSNRDARLPGVAMHNADLPPRQRVSATPPPRTALPFEPSRPSPEGIEPEVRRATFVAKATPIVEAGVRGQVSLPKSELEMVQWLKRFLEAGDRNDAEAEAKFYADSVALFDEGNKSRAEIVRDLAGYQKQWPSRTSTLEGEPNIVFNDAGGSCSLSFTFRFEARNSRQFNRGKAQTTIVALRTAGGPLIMSIRQLVTEREKGVIQAPSAPAVARIDENDLSESENPVSGQPVPAKPGLLSPSGTVRSCTIVGIRAGDTLNVRSGPGMKMPTRFTLMNGETVRISAASVFNGDTEWFPIVFESGTGWVPRKYLQAQ